MRKTAKFCVAILLTLGATIGRAQENSNKAVAEGHFYHLVFQLEEVDGGRKVVNTRAYTTTVYTGDTRVTSIRNGTRIPVVTNTGKGDVTYLDLGVKIDAKDVAEKEDKLQLDLTVVQSSIASTAGKPPDPVVRQNTWTGKVILPLGKATVIFSSDNLENRGGTQLELTATRID